MNAILCYWDSRILCKLLKIMSDQPAGRNKIDLFTKQDKYL